ncbi:nuclear transport factor 2 family protein [Pontibacter cellulosilyticus]|uniref:Nuclear transport factor 2 family protein n=1 Tax=Pontibacter cellulosilyticus TaxID=1720253 RepID=A0A923N573_9BACT|nr:nuclear transport factor 2 family protein [Pontibacter cellulosilyticus]MBC5992451.1 nuclear transport factor 2 family protein [Pontibacter cellulosilyticus]
MKSVILTALFILLGMTAYSQQNQNTEALLAPVKQQLEAYNSRDIEKFASAFSENVKVYRQPGVLTYQGRDELKKRYGAMFAATPDLHCEIVNRIVAGEVVIDQEKVQRTKGQPRTDAIAVYRVKDGLIVEVTFIPPVSN